MHKPPLGTGEMLTREEFERLQHTFRTASGLPLPRRSAFPPPAANLPPSAIPAQRPPPHLVYPAHPVLQPPPATVMVTRQPVVMAPPLYEQRLPAAAPRPGLVMEPAGMLLARPREIGLQDPRLVPRPHAEPPPPVVFHRAPPTVVQSLPPPPPGVFERVLPAAGFAPGGPAPGPRIVIMPGNPQVAAQLPPPPSSIRLPLP